MKKIILIFCLALSFSCKKDEPQFSIDTGVFIAYKDSNNQDLLAPSTPNNIKAEDIDIYRLLNTGQKKQIYDANMDMPESFAIGKSSNGIDYLMTLGLAPCSDCYSTQNKATFFIRYKDGSEDTLVGEYNADRTYHITLLKIWINGTLKYDVGPSNTKPTTPIIIVK